FIYRLISVDCGGCVVVYQMKYVRNVAGIRLCVQWCACATRSIVHPIIIHNSCGEITKPMVDQADIPETRIGSLSRNSEIIS
ncbi:hypothetical protein CRM22_008323, partial [Opisthorchis felineus]